jgi:hypothetical protein
MPRCTDGRGFYETINRVVAERRLCERGRQVTGPPFLSDFARVHRLLVAVQYRMYGGWLYGQPLQCARSWRKTAASSTRQM